MTMINRLTAAPSVSDGDLFPMWKTSAGDTLHVAASALKAYCNPASGSDAQAYAAPSASGFTVTLSGVQDQWLILTPVAGYAAGTIVLPSSPVNLQRVTVNCTQSVGTLTVSGGTVTGAPSSLSANGFFTMRYDAVVNAWYRVG
jgi:hypothetical protein